VSVCIRKVGTASDRRALVTSSLASTLLSILAATSFTTRGQFRSVVIGSRPPRETSRVGIVASVTVAFLSVDEAVRYIVKAPFGAAHVLVVPEGGSTVVALHVVVSLCRLKRLSMITMIVVPVVGVIVLLDS
jgi:hypothetical protein